jgi:hypothetical protein
MISRVVGGTDAREIMGSPEFRLRVRDPLGHARESASEARISCTILSLQAARAFWAGISSVN